MPDFSIPKPEAGVDEPSELTAIELADLSANKRNTYLYEEHKRTLQTIVRELQAQKTELEQKREVDRTELMNKKATERAHCEAIVSFALATIIMTIGGGLISSFPMQKSEVPWQFALGWAFIISGIIFGIFSRMCVSVAMKVRAKLKA